MSLHGVAGGVGRDCAPVDVEGDHRPEPPHLASGQLVARGVGQAGVAHGGHRGVPGQAPGELAGRGLGPLQAERQGAQPAQRQERLEGPGHRPAHAAAGGEGGGDLRVARHRGPHHQVGVSGQQLGRAVDHDVRAQVQRALQERGGQGVVDGDAHARGVRSAGQQRDVRDLEEGVGGGLDPEQVGAAAHGHRPGAVGHVRQPHPQVAARGGVGQQAPHAVVAARRGDHDGAGRQAVEDGRRGGHARGEGQRAAALQRPDGRLQRGPGGVAVASVVRPLAPGAVGGGERDGHAQRLAGRACAPAGDDGDRREVHGYATGSSTERGRQASPRGTARVSSMSAVSAIGTPVRWSSRPSKSVTIARTAAA